ncbi:MAG TPA: anti-phage dCTP deaminase, partial [Kofleriaceae bacterium]
ATGRSSQTAIRESAANEVVFAVVGHVGSGTSEVAKLLKTLLSHPGLAGGPFDTEILKARDQLRELDGAAAALAGLKEDTLEYADQLQDLGDSMRNGGDHAAVARTLILRVRQLRASKRGITDYGDKPVEPDGKRRAYILDSIRHPAEVELLRNVYQSAFVLVGIVCDEDVRLRRIQQKYSDAGERNARLFMERDAKASEKHGQRVSDAFHLADIFLDNSTDRYSPIREENKHWVIPDQLRRLVKIVTHADVVRPTPAETAMHAAHGAQIRSACLSRQVGAALVDQQGNLVSTGTNEVPKAGGGVYGEDFDADESRDHRCAYKQRYCSSTQEQNTLIDELVTLLVEAKATSLAPDALQTLLKGSRLRQLLEFSRAVHAEMDAVLRAGRQGTSTVGTRVFVTTYPCHYCARHLVAAGVDEVQYIEPYPKSRATRLHADAISTEPIDWVPPSGGGDKVLFRPFVGVAPRLYRRAFLKDRDLKDDISGTMTISEPAWATPWYIGRISYVELEAKLAQTERETQPIAERGGPKPTDVV